MEIKKNVIFVTHAMGLSREILTRSHKVFDALATMILKASIWFTNCPEKHQYYLSGDFLILVVNSLLGVAGPPRARGWRGGAPHLGASAAGLVSWTSSVPPLATLC